MPSPPRIFKSAVGLFYYGILLFIVVTTYAAFKPVMAQQTGPALIFPLITTLLFGWGLPVWLLFTTDYTVSDEYLNIRTGPFKWTIKRSDITGIEPSRSLISSPALSLDRLQIRYGNNKSIHVSPKDRQGFYRALGFAPQP